MDHFSQQLSGGEQQRVAIARALSNDPEIILLDEPTGDLETKNTDFVMKTLIDLNLRSDRKITLLMVTHDLNLRNYGTKVVRIVDGKIGSIIDTPKEIRMKAIDELNERILKSENQKIKIQFGIEEAKANPRKEEILREKAFTSFPINSVYNTSVRIHSDYIPVKMASKNKNKLYKKSRDRILKK